MLSLRKESYLAGSINLKIREVPSCELESDAIETSPMRPSNIAWDQRCFILRLEVSILWEKFDVHLDTGFAQF